MQLPLPNVPYNIQISTTQSYVHFEKILERLSLIERVYLHTFSSQKGAQDVVGLFLYFNLFTRVNTTQHVITVKLLKYAVFYNGIGECIPIPSVYTIRLLCHHNGINS